MSTTQIHPNSFTAIYRRELQKFSEVETPGVARVFAIKNVATQMDISYERCRELVEILEAEGMA